MKHLNDNLLCVVTAFLTGADCSKDDILQLCIVPLDFNLKVSASIQLYCVDMLPRKGGADKVHLGHRMSQMAKLYNKGFDPYIALEMLDNWFELTMLRSTKKIMPLTHNWPLTRDFLIDWMGLNTFNDYFSIEYRDILPVTLYCNDRAGWHGEAYPYPKHRLSYVASQLGVDYMQKYDIMREAQSIADIYRIMMSNFISM